MAPDEIKIGKVYKMKSGVKDRRVIDILWYPAGTDGYVHEYCEVVCSFASGKRRGLTEKVSLAWFANAAQHEVV